MRHNHSEKLIPLLMLFVVSLLIGCSRKEDFAMSLNGVWKFKVDSMNTGVSQRWFDKGHDRSDWTAMDVPDYWDRYNLLSYDGPGWYVTTLSIGENQRNSVIFFGGVDDDADVWLDGVKIGSHTGYSEPFYVDLPVDITPGIKELVIRVDDHSGPGGIYKPVKLVPRDRVLEMYKTKYSEHPARPSQDWVSDAVLYEVYLRSFSKGGTFGELERRLPELKDLGVTVLWLMPIHPTGELNRKGTLGSPYAVQDYYKVNPEFGTLDDFKSLVAAAHSQGMKIIIVLVANHTSWDSRLMMEHPEWFTTNADGAIVSPNADWTDVADLNYDRHELRKHMIEMMKYWVRDIGIDGFRCDVAEMVPTDFWNRARKELDKIKPIMMLSEGTLPEHHAEAFDMTYSWTLYDVLAKVIGGSTPVKVFDDILTTESYQFPKGSLRMRFNTNHDKNAWDSPAVLKFSPQGAKMTALLTFTYPGVPLLYNGEEVGNDKKLSLFEKVDIDWTKNYEFRAFYRALTRLRSTHPALRNGEYVSVKNSDGEKVYSFVRRAGNDEVLVVLNFARDPRSVSIDVSSWKARELKEYFTGSAATLHGGKLPLEIGGLGCRVFVPASQR
ncbi:MAG: alpha-amylase family glycosyl hydrolase [Ignavibacteriales bacterium]|nr:alpha-amylase family glycosyl hydrolase [Ignavibacteriales bacterium]